jgi:hypothetical protein
VSKKKIIYGVIIAVGFVALTVDRLTGDGPAQAAASPKPAATADTKVALDEGSPLANGAAGRVAAASFPRQLEGPQTGGPVRDAFGLTPAIIKVMRPPEAEQPAGQPGKPGEQPAKPRMTADRFISEHRLTAVMHGPAVAIAVVNGQWIEPGQALDECKLVEITGRSALFECSGEIAELTVEIPGQTGRP